MRSRLSFAILLAGLIGLAFAPVAAQEELSAARIFELPGDELFPEGVAVNNDTGTFYVGSTNGGEILQGDIASGEVSVLSEGSDDRTFVTGMDIADDGSLYVAGAASGTVYVIDTESGDTIESASNGLGEEETFLNDLVLGDDGTVYVTDSIDSTIWTMGEDALEPWLDLTDSAITYEEGFNLNGIVLSDDGTTLLVVQSNTGNLYRIDIESQEIEQVDLGDESLPGGDGMVLDGSYLYVVGNGEIRIVQLEDDLSSGTVTGSITDSSFSSPTTAAQTGACLLVVNSQFGNREAGPELPFTISGIAIPFENLSTPVAMEDVIACAVG